MSPENCPGCGIALPDMMSKEPSVTGTQRTDQAMLNEKPVKLSKPKKIRSVADLKMAAIFSKEKGLPK